MKKNDEEILRNFIIQSPIKLPNDPDEEAEFDERKQNGEFDFVLAMMEQARHDEQANIMATAENNASHLLLTERQRNELLGWGLIPSFLNKEVDALLDALQNQMLGKLDFFILCKEEQHKQLIKKLETEVAINTLNAFLEYEKGTTEWDHGAAVKRFVRESGLIPY